MQKIDVSLGDHQIMLTMKVLAFFFWGGFFLCPSDSQG